MIIDKFQRKHDYLRISITERCNLRCFYCMPESGVALSPKNHLMTYEEILQIARIFVGMGVRKIRLTGGEPLVRKEVDFIIKGLGQLPVELAMTTNGILVHQHIDAFKKAGLQKINISLDTLRADRFAQITKRNSFDKVWQNILLLQKHGFKVKLNAVLMNDVNLDEIQDFISLTQHMPIQVQFIEFMPFDGNAWDWKRGVSKEEILGLTGAYFGAEKLLKISDSPNDTASNYQIKGHRGSFGIISAVSNPFCDSCNRLRLTANGRLKNCLFSNTETDLLSSYRLGKDIRPLIVQNIKGKEKERGGWEHFEDSSHPDNRYQNRSMILIGG